MLVFVGDGLAKLGVVEQVRPPGLESLRGALLRHVISATPVFMGASKASVLVLQPAPFLAFHSPLPVQS